MLDRRDKRADEPSPGLSDGVLDLRLHSVFRTLTQRVFVIHGTIEAEIKYDGLGVGERVLVNGELAGRSSGFTLSVKPVTVAPRIDFSFCSRGRRLSGRVEVSVYWAFWKGIKDFRLQIANRVIYDEHRGKIIIPEDTAAVRMWVGSREDES